MQAIEFCQIVHDLSNGDLCNAAEELGATYPRYLTNFLTDTEVLVCLFKGAVWIVPRATKSRRDVLTDLKFWKRRGRHAGFIGAADSVWNRVSAFVDAHPGLPIVVAGHSLGAAITLSLGEWLRDEDTSRKVDAITFGQPRLWGPRAGKKSAAKFNRYIRWVNDRDAVPRLPFALFGMYKHQGDLHYIKADGTLSNKPSDAVKGRVNGWIKMVRTFKSEGVSDHSAALYKKQIAGLETVGD